MHDELTRRRLLASVGTVAVAGCLDGASSAELPEGCPTTQGLGVDWPERPDASAAESFVEEYEHVYYRDVVVEYEPESRVDAYDLGVRVSDGPTEAGDGWEVGVSGGGGIYTPTLMVTATVSNPPGGAEVVPASAVDDDALNDVLVRAAGNESGTADFHVDSPGERVDEYIERLASLSETFDPPSAPGDSGVLYVDVDGTTVELEARATSFHGDYGWQAWYYVDDRVVRRTTDEGTDPRNGELLECRESG